MFVDKIEEIGHAEWSSEVQLEPVRTSSNLFLERSELLELHNIMFQTLPLLNYK